MFEYREHQRETIDKLHKALERHKVVFLDAPVGAGKSPINIITANEEGTAYMTTPQRRLTDQFEETLTTILKGYGTTIKGRSNYACQLGREEGLGRYMTAGDSPCFFGKYKGKAFSAKRCKYYSSCGYFVRKEQAIRAQLTGTTFSYFVYGILPVIDPPVEEVTDIMDNYIQQIMVKAKIEETPITWNQRKLIIIDEAHNLSEALIDKFTITFNDSVRLPDFPFKNFWNEVDEVLEGEENEDLKIFDIMKKYLDVYIMSKASRLEHIESLLEDDYNKELEQEEQELLKTLHNAREKLMTLTTDVEWVFIRGHHSLTWKPYTVANLMRNEWQKFDKILLSSATFLNYDLLIEETGLPDDYEVVSVPNVFPKENAKIFLMDVAKLNKDNIASLYGEFAKKIEYIASKYPNSKGLVHCVSYPNQLGLKKFLSDRFITHTPQNRDKVVTEWENSKSNKILLSVAMEEGLDLKYDKSRFQIIFKAPYLNVGDKWIKEHQKREGWGWYNTKTLIKVLQASGRVMRAKDDKGDTFILDSNVHKLILQLYNSSPLWFKERLINL